MSNLLWIQGLSCNGNTQSFFCAENIDIFLKSINILYHPAISYSDDLFQIIDKIENGDINLNFLVIEGAITKNKDICRLGDFSIVEILEKIIPKTDYIIAVGNCASFGNIPALYRDDIKGLQFKFKEKNGYLAEDFKTRKNYPVINISGCPAHPEWIIRTILQLHYGYEIKLDKYNRPKELYMYLTHDGCIRNEYFEWKVEATEFGKKEGCLFIELGCRGPMTHSSCNKILWNNTSSKTRTGMPCIGCTEFDFPRKNMFETKKNIGIPEDIPLGVSKRAYIMISGVAKTFKNERLEKKLEETE